MIFRKLNELVAVLKYQPQAFMRILLLEYVVSDRFAIAKTLYQEEYQPTLLGKHAANFGIALCHTNFLPDANQPLVTHNFCRKTGLVMSIAVSTKCCIKQVE